MITIIKIHRTCICVLLSWFQHVSNSFDCILQISADSNQWHLMNLGFILFDYLVHLRSVIFGLKTFQMPFSNHMFQGSLQGSEVFSLGFHLCFYGFLMRISLFGTFNAVTLRSLSWIDLCIWRFYPYSLTVENRIPASNPCIESNHASIWMVLQF